LAIGKEGELTIGTIDDIQKLHIRTVPLGEHPCRISHQEHSRTFAICSAKYSPSGSNGEDMETHYVRLIDDQTFEIISSFALDPYENGCSIITCSFTDDFNAYYCVGTAYALPEESEPSKVCFISYFSFLCEYCCQYCFSSVCKFTVYVHHCPTDISESCSFDCAHSDVSCAIKSSSAIALFLLASFQP
jgi:hypothetical protein